MAEKSDLHEGHKLATPYTQAHRRDWQLLDLGCGCAWKPGVEAGGESRTVTSLQCGCRSPGKSSDTEDFRAHEIGRFYETVRCALIAGFRARKWNVWTSHPSEAVDIRPTIVSY